MGKLKRQVGCLLLVVILVLPAGLSQITQLPCASTTLTLVGNFILEDCTNQSAIITVNGSMSAVPAPSLTIFNAQILKLVVTGNIRTSVQFSLQQSTLSSIVLSGVDNLEGFTLTATELIVTAATSADSVAMQINGCIFRDGAQFSIQKSHFTSGVSSSPFGTRTAVELRNTQFLSSSTMRFVETTLNAFGGGRGTAFSLVQGTVFSGGSRLALEKVISTAMGSIATNANVDRSGFSGPGSSMQVLRSSLTSLGMDVHATSIWIVSSNFLQAGAAMDVSHTSMSAAAEGGQTRGRNIAIESSSSISNAIMTFHNVTALASGADFMNNVRFDQTSIINAVLNLTQCTMSAMGAEAITSSFVDGPLSNVSMLVALCSFTAKSTRVLAASATSIVANFQMFAVAAQHFTLDVVSSAWTAGATQYPAASIAIEGFGGSLAHSLLGFRGSSFFVETSKNATFVTMSVKVTNTTVVSVAPSASSSQAPAFVNNFTVRAKQASMPTAAWWFRFAEDPVNSEGWEVDGLRVWLLQQLAPSSSAVGRTLVIIEGAIGGSIVGIESVIFKSETGKIEVMIEGGGAVPDAEGLAGHYYVVRATTALPVVRGVPTWASAVRMSNVEVRGGYSVVLRSVALSLDAPLSVQLLVAEKFVTSAFAPPANAAASIEAMNVFVTLRKGAIGNGGTCRWIATAPTAALTNNITIEDVTTQTTNCDAFRGVELGDATPSRCVRVKVSNSRLRVGNELLAPPASVAQLRELSILHSQSSCVHLEAQNTMIKGLRSASSSVIAALVAWVRSDPAALGSSTISLHNSSLVSMRNLMRLQSSVAGFADSQLPSGAVSCSFFNGKLIRPQDFVPVPSSRFVFAPLTLAEQKVVCPWSVTASATETPSQTKGTLSTSLTVSVPPLPTRTTTPSPTQSLSSSDEATATATESDAATMSVSASESHAATWTAEVTPTAPELPTATNSLTSTRAVTDTHSAPPTTSAPLTRTATFATGTLSDDATATVSLSRSVTVTLTESQPLARRPCAPFTVDYRLVTSASTANASAEAPPPTGANSGANSAPLRISNEQISKGATLELTIATRSNSTAWSIVTEKQVSLVCLGSFVCQQGLDQALARSPVTASIQQPRVMRLLLPPFSRFDRDVTVRLRLAGEALACPLLLPAEAAKQLTKDLLLEAKVASAPLSTFAATAVASASVISAAASPAAVLDAQALAVFSLIDCASGKDRYAMDKARFLLSPYSIGPGPEGFLWGNVVTLLCVLVLQGIVTVARKKLPPGMSSWVKASAVARFPSLFFSASLIYQQGNSILSFRLLVDGRVSFVSLLCSAYAIAFPVGIAILYRRKASARFFAVAGSKLEFYRYEPTVTAHWPDTRFYRALRHWCVPVGRWGPTLMRRRFGSMVSPLVPTWLAFASMPMLQANAVTILAAVKGDTAERCVTQYALLVLLHVLLAGVVAWCRPYRSRMLNLQAAFMYLVLAAILVNSAVLAVNPFNELASSAAPILLVAQLTVSVGRTVYIIWVKIVERCWWQDHATTTVWCAARDDFETRDAFSKMFTAELCGVLLAPSSKSLHELEELGAVEEVAGATTATTTGSDADDHLEAPLLAGRSGGP